MHAKVNCVNQALFFLKELKPRRRPSEKANVTGIGPRDVQYVLSASYEDICVSQSNGYYLPDKQQSSRKVQLTPLKKSEFQHFMVSMFDGYLYSTTRKWLNVIKTKNLEYIQDADGQF